MQWLSLNVQVLTTTRESMQWDMLPPDVWSELMMSRLSCAHDNSNHEVKIRMCRMCFRNSIIEQSSQKEAPISLISDKCSCLSFGYRCRIMTSERREEYCVPRSSLDPKSPDNVATDKTSNSMSAFATLHMRALWDWSSLKISASVHCITIVSIGVITSPDLIKHYDSGHCQLSRSWRLYVTGNFLVCAMWLNERSSQYSSTLMTIPVTSCTWLQIHMLRLCRNCFDVNRSPLYFNSCPLAVSTLDLYFVWLWSSRCFVVRTRVHLRSCPSRRARRADLLLANISFVLVIFVLLRQHIGLHVVSFSSAFWNSSSFCLILFITLQELTSCCCHCLVCVQTLHLERWYFVHEETSVHRRIDVISSDHFPLVSVLLSLIDWSTTISDAVCSETKSLTMRIALSAILIRRHVSASFMAVMSLTTISSDPLTFITNTWKSSSDTCSPSSMRLYLILCILISELT